MIKIVFVEKMSTELMPNLYEVYCQSNFILINCFILVHSQIFMATVPLTLSNVKVGLPQCYHRYTHGAE